MVNPIQFQPAGPLADPASRPVQRNQGNSDFASVLRERVSQSRPITFSAHAEQRLESRNINLSPDDQARMAKAIDDAAAKGARETLLLMDERAFVVNVPSRRVVTVLEPGKGENAVFTNIDSTVLVGTSKDINESTAAPGLDPFRGGPDAADRLTRRS